MAVWIPLLSTVELGIGLIAAALPSLGAMFHFFDPPKKSISSGRRYTSQPRVASYAFSSKAPWRDNFRLSGSKSGDHWTTTSIATPRVRDDAMPKPGGIIVTTDVSRSISIKSRNSRLIFQGSDGSIGTTIGTEDDRYDQAGVELKRWRDIA